MKIIKILLCTLIVCNSAFSQNNIWSKAPEGGLIYYGVFDEVINYKFESSVGLDIQKFKNVYFTKVKESQKKVKLEYNKNDKLITERIDNQEKLLWLINRLYGYNMLNSFKANLEKKEIYDFYSTDAEKEIMKQSAKGKHVYIINGNLIYAIPGFPVKEIPEYKLSLNDEQFLKNLCSEIDVLYCLPFNIIESLFPNFSKSNHLNIEVIRNILAYIPSEKFTSEIINLFFKNFLI